MEPQEQLASWYMGQKGYPDIEPRDVVKLDNQPCWYFVYDLPEGTLELEVFYKNDEETWDITVTTFALKLYGGEK